MKLRQLAAAAALAGMAATAHAVVLNFDNPGFVTFNPDDSQTLVEQGYALSGPLFSFQPIDNGGGNGVITGDGTAFSLQQVGGGAFSLLNLDYAFEPIFGGMAGTLTVAGMRNGTQVAVWTLPLDSLTSAAFNSSFSMLTSVTFSANSGFSVDNIAVVPEPASLVLMLLGLGALGMCVKAGRAPARQRIV